MVASKSQPLPVPKEHEFDRPKTLRRRLPTTVPELVPARMVNEVLYCERLMYLEWVQGEFADNAFTVEGRFVHRRPDKSGGKLRRPPQGQDAANAEAQTEGADPPYQARSLWLSSERLGLTAKIDVVEEDGDTVVPIEYKRGAAPDLAEGAYLPELAQVCAQGLLLREHGYTCDAGAIWFAESRRRVPVPFTDQLVGITLWAIKRVRELAQLGELPPPLIDNPKCPGCSLNPICLPDEVSLLRRLDGLDVPEEDPNQDEAFDGPLSPDPWGIASGSADADTGCAAQPLRRLYPAREDRIPVYVTDHRSQVRLSGERLVISGKEGATHARLMNTSHVSIFGNAQISTQALRALLERGIPLVFFSGSGWFLGRATGHASNNIDLRISQYRWASDEQLCLKLAQAFIASKIRNCRTLLRRNLSAPEPTVLRHLTQLRRRTLATDSLDELLGVEGAAARAYFQAFSGTFKQTELGEFHFEQRNRRPPRDPINALLSFAYALLSKDYATTVATVGFEPLLGFYHQPRFGRPSLALDLMEEMRPLIADSVVINAVNTRVVTPADFVFGPNSCALKAPARRRLLEAYERRMDQLVTHPIFGYRISYRRVLEVQARLLGRVLTGELDAYPPFGTR